MLTHLEHVLSETVMSMRRHPMMAFAATTCIAATLFVAGIVGLALLNAHTAVRSALDEVRFVVYFHPETPREETWAAYKRIKALEGVVAQTAEFRPKEKYWSKLQREDPQLTRMIGKNPVPDAVAVQAADVRNIPALESQIKGWPEVKTINDSPEVTSFLLRVQQLVGKIGLGLSLILLLLSLVIVHHTIELTLYARRKEIHIMSLVGAAPTTVAMPFLLEGVTYGLIGGGVSFGFLYLLYQYFTRMIQSDIGSQIARSPELLSHGIMLLAAAGIFLGLIGSLISVVKYLHRPRSRVTNA